MRAALGAVPASGWASLMVVSSFMGGLMLVAIAFLGEYAWRILDEVRGAPPFIEARQADVTGRAWDGAAVTATPETTRERALPAGGGISESPVGSLRSRGSPRISGAANASESSGGSELPKEIDREVVQRS